MDTFVSYMFDPWLRRFICLVNRNGNFSKIHLDGKILREFVSNLSNLFRIFDGLEKYSLLVEEYGKKKISRAEFDSKSMLVIKEISDALNDFMRGIEVFYSGGLREFFDSVEGCVVFSPSGFLHFVPWELLPLDDPLMFRSDVKTFRTFYFKWDLDDVLMRNAYILIGRGFLPYSIREAKDLRDMFIGHGFDTRFVDLSDLRSIFDSLKYSGIFHYTGHGALGYYVEGYGVVTRSELKELLKRRLSTMGRPVDERFLEYHIAERVGYSRIFPFLSLSKFFRLYYRNILVTRNKGKGIAFLNSCYSGIMYPGVAADFRNLLVSLINSGYKSVFAPLIPITDEFGREFSLNFYRKLFDGYSVVDSLHEVKIDGLNWKATEKFANIMGYKYYGNRFAKQYALWSIIGYGYPYFKLYP